MILRVLSVFFLIFVSACACVDERVDLSQDTTRLTDIKQTSDPYLAKIFTRLPDSYNLSWRSNAIEVLSYVGLYIPRSLDTIELYRKKRVSQPDLVAQLYRKAVVARGNQLRTYSPAANEAIVGCFQQNPNADVFRRFDLDNSLVEYDKDGNMVSAMVRIHRFVRNMVTDEHFVVTKIYTGKLINVIERDLKDFNFAGNLIASK